MPKREIIYNEVLRFLERLPHHKFKGVVHHYSVNNKSNFEKDLDLMITLNFQQRLESLSINKYWGCCKMIINHFVTAHSFLSLIL